jgi:hypothetical protein
MDTSTAEAREDAHSSGIHRIDEGGAVSPFQPALPGGPSTSLPREPVTLIVFGWNSVEPGTLAWVFPSVGAALTAARAMTNAVKWAIVAGSPSGDEMVDVATARASGAVLFEQ